MYPKEITLRYLTGQAMQNCGGPSGGIIFVSGGAPLEDRRHVSNGVNRFGGFLLKKKKNVVIWGLVKKKATLDSRYSIIDFRCWMFAFIRNNHRFYVLSRAIPPYNIVL